MRTISRLEKTLFRLQAQHACLSWLFNAIAGKPGVVVEFGLGQGRTFDHLRRHLPDRDIYVFDRVNKAYDDCQPDPAFLFLGEIDERFSEAMQCIAGRVVLANSDIGSFDRNLNSRNAEMSSRLLGPVMAPGGFIMSDLPLNLPNFSTLPLPNGAPDDRYYLYQNAR